MGSSSRNWKYEVPRRGSLAVQVLESAWQLLREIVPEIPPVVLTFIDMKSRHRLRGYIAYSTWRKRRGSAHEIAISPKLIGRPTDLLATMLHEAAHGVLYATGQDGGMGSSRYYHKKEFRDQCQRLGLKCEFLNTRYGWTVTSWPPSGVPNRYKPIIALLRGKLPAGTETSPKYKIKGRRLPATGHTMLVCKCAGGTRSVYVKKSVLEAGGIVCSFCGQEFRRSSPA